MNSKKKVVLSGAFKEAHKTKKRYRILYGGAGSGKSHFVAQEILFNMMRNGEYSYLVVRKTGKSIKLSVFKLLVSLISEYDLNAFFDVNKSDMSMRCITGSALVTSGLDDVEKLKSIANINRIWIEEASEISEADFEQLDLRMRGVFKVGHQMTLTFNPISELHWLKKRFFDIGEDEAFILKTTYKQNSFLDEAYLKKMDELVNRDYQLYRVYALGEWGSLGNLIFRNWIKMDLSEDLHLFDNVYHGLDFGFADDPFAFVSVHVDLKKKILYIYDELYQSETHNDEIARLLLERIEYEMVTCDSAEPKSIAELRRYGVNTKGAKKGKDSVLYGINWLKGFQIVIDEKCVNTIKEFSGYKWREDKDGNVIPKPIDMNNHIIDALRYALEIVMLDKGSTWGWK